MSSREYLLRAFHGGGTQAHESHPTLPQDRAARDPFASGPSLRALGLIGKLGARHLPAV